MNILCYLIIILFAIYYAYTGYYYYKDGKKEIKIDKKG